MEEMGYAPKTSASTNTVVKCIGSHVTERTSGHLSPVFPVTVCHTTFLPLVRLSQTPFLVLTHADELVALTGYFRTLAKIGFRVWVG